MNAGPVLAVLALALAAYGVYTALHIPAMFVAPPMPLLIVCFLAQAACALAAALAVWRYRRWAAAALLALAGAITLTQLVEVLLGILPYLRAIAVSLLAIVAALALAAYVDRAQPTNRGG